MKKIDIHVHSRIYLSEEEEKNAIYRPIQDKLTYPAPEEIAILYEKLGIEKGVLMVTIAPEGAHYTFNNLEAMRIVRKYPDRFYWFCGIDPRCWTNSADTDLSHFINHYKKHGAKGIGEVTAKLPFSDERMQNLFRHAEMYDMPVLIHIGTDDSPYGIYDVKGLKQLEETLTRFPKLTIIGHSQPFWAEIGADSEECDRFGYPSGPVKKAGRLVELMRKYDNLHADLSANSGYNAITRDPDFGYEFLEEFQDRIYYGTGICSKREEKSFKLAQFLEQGVEKNKLSDRAYRKICRTNALRLLER